MRHALESHKAFKPIAWVIFLSGALFVVFLVLQLKSTNNELGQRATHTTSAIDAGIKADFETN